MRHLSGICFTLCLLTAPAFADGVELGRLSLTGVGDVVAEPDKATISLGVLTQRKTAAEALQQNSKDMTDAIAAIKAAGIESKDIQTANFSIQPQYSYIPNQPQKLSGYAVNNTIILNVNDLTKLGSILDKVVTLGVNTVDGPHFGFKESDKLEEQAKVKAIDDVKKPHNFIHVA